MSQRNRVYFNLCHTFPIHAIVNFLEHGRLENSKSRQTPISLVLWWLDLNQRQRAKTISFSGKGKQLQICSLMNIISAQVNGDSQGPLIYKFLLKAFCIKCLVHKDWINHKNWHENNSPTMQLQPWIPKKIRPSSFIHYWPGPNFQKTPNETVDTG